MITPPLLVIGAGGLLGSSLLRSSPSAVSPPAPIRWAHDPLADLTDTARWFGRLVNGGEWRVAWCAGSGGVGTPPSDLSAETRSLERFLEALASSCSMKNGAVFLASSAGGIHARSVDDMISERSPVAPMSAYGESKLDQETLARAWSTATGATVAIGRLSNLYGPGQKSTRQGLISSLVRASLRSEPLLVFVPLDTVRDYLYAPDAARRVHDFLERAARDRDESHRVTVKLIASGRPATVGEVIADVRRIRKRRPPIIFGVTDATRLQPVALRFRSEVWPELDRVPLATLAEGIAAVVRDQLQRLGTGTAA